MPISPRSGPSLLFGRVASDPTVSRLIDTLAEDAAPRAGGDQDSGGHIEGSNDKRDTQKVGSRGPVCGWWTSSGPMRCAG